MKDKLFEKILSIANKKDTCKDEINDLISLTRNRFSTDKEEALEMCREIKRFIGKRMKRDGKVGYLREAHFQVLCLETPYSLDSYFQALEFERPLEEKFWLPRRKQLLPILHKIEDLLIYDKLDELFISQPARTGKTTLAMFVVSWKMGIDPEAANLYCSNSGVLVNAFYKGILEIITDNYTYMWWKIFPNVKFDKNSYTNAKDTYIDVGRVKRYHSFTGRSIDGGLNGAVDVSNGGIMVGDDLVSGYEEALNPSRLMNLWGKVDNDLITRCKMGAKMLWIGTRWSIADPIARRLATLEGTSRRYDIINIPDLNENNESNFDYLFDKGFSAEYFMSRRASFERNNDLASYLAQYRGEPVERSGLLFPPENIKTYNGVLPSDTPDRKFAYCDIAWGGGDYTSMPICYQFGNVGYIVDWVFSAENKMITRPQVINAIIKHGLGSVRFEKNNGGDEYREYIETELIKKGKKVLISSKTTTVNKQVKIYEHAPEITELYFLKPELRSQAYSLAVQQLTCYTGLDKKQHDDAPDSLSGLIDMKNEIVQVPTIEIFKRIF